MHEFISVVMFGSGCFMLGSWWELRRARLKREKQESEANK